MFFIFNVCLVKTFLIEALDGREINDLTREFLINWKASREAKKKKNNKHDVWSTHPLFSNK